MSKIGLISLLQSIVASQSAAGEVALLLSGGIDSYSVGVACELAGKKVVAYTYELEGIASVDRTKAEMLAQRRGWALKLVVVPTSFITHDFYRLIGEWGCRKKTHVEVLFPMMYILPAIEQDVIFTGWNADNHYVNTAEDQRKLAVLRQSGASAPELAEAFEGMRRRQYAESDAPNSQTTFWIASRMATAFGKQFLDPYADDKVRQYFSL